MKNFYYCTDPDGKIPSMCRNAPDRPTWVKYVNDKPVRISPCYPHDKVWDYRKQKYVPVTKRMRQFTLGVML